MSNSENEWSISDKGNILPGLFEESDDEEKEEEDMFVIAINKKNTFIDNIVTSHKLNEKEVEKNIDLLESNSKDFRFKHELFKEELILKKSQLLPSKNRSINNLPQEDSTYSLLRQKIQERHIKINGTAFPPPPPPPVMKSILKIHAFKSNSNVIIHPMPIPIAPPLVLYKQEQKEVMNPAVLNEIIVNIDELNVKLKMDKEENYSPENSLINTNFSMLFKTSAFGHNEKSVVRRDEPKVKGKEDESKLSNHHTTIFMPTDIDSIEIDMKGSLEDENHWLFNKLMYKNTTMESIQTIFVLNKYVIPISQLFFVIMLLVTVMEIPFVSFTMNLILAINFMLLVFFPLMTCLFDTENNKLDMNKSKKMKQIHSIYLFYPILALIVTLFSFCYSLILIVVSLRPEPIDLLESLGSMNAAGKGLFTLIFLTCITFTASIIVFMVVNFKLYTYFHSREERIRILSFNSKRYI